MIYDTHMPDIILMEVDVLKESLGNVLLAGILCHVESRQVDERPLPNLHHGGRPQPHVAP